MKRWWLALAFLVGCGSAPGATCGPCGDGAIACGGTLAACVGEDGCQTKIGATGAGTLTLEGDGTFVETSAAGTTTGTWSQSGDVVALKTNAGPTALLAVYEDGAVCPYAGGQQ